MARELHRTFLDFSEVMVLWRLGLPRWDMVPTAGVLSGERRGKVCGVPTAPPGKGGLGAGFGFGWARLGFGFS